MSDINELAAKIDGVLSSLKDKAKQDQQAKLQEHRQRQQALQGYEKAREQIVAIAKPRLQLLAKRAGDRVSVTPIVSDNRRAAKFEFKSAKADIKLTVSVAPDLQVQNAVVDFDLHIVPVLWRYESHASFSTPITRIDEAGLVKWLDDRIVNFVKLFIEIHEAELFDKAEYVEDPIAKVKFPKFAAGATLEHGGQTYFFVDENTKAEFAKQNKIANA
jgi:YHS domain-containing protein